MGVAFNASGDPGHSTLGRHRINIAISTNSNWSARLDAIRTIPVQIPARMSGGDYFAGRDPAVEAILSAPAPYPDVLTTLEERGGGAARELWNEQSRRYDGVEWWEPFPWEGLNELSYRLLGRKRTDDAIAGFELNSERFHSRWESWDSLGDAYREAGRRAAAKAAFERALALAPDNWNAEHQRKMIEELTGKTRLDR